MNYRWTLRPLDDEAAVPALARALNDLPEALARALVLRGVGSFERARGFFRDGLDTAHDPFLLRDMDRAADRLAEAVQRRERVLVYGDYDVDGTTAAATMVAFLRAQGAEATYFIPNRFEHGYGLCRDGLDEAVERGARLVVALDCGITATDQAEYAKLLGLDLVIGDHHEPGPELPDALAVLDPKRADCPYPFTGLSGCGVGFKLIQATLARLGRPPEEAHPYLDLLAVSIAADLVPVLGENRVLMRAGLDRLRTAPRLGLRALAESAGVDLAACATSRIVFGLGPRINAAGRLGSADRAVDLFLTDDPAEARRLAAELEAINQERRQLDRAMLAEALDDAEGFVADADPFALVLHRPRWHPGVLGIVAARVVEHFYRPAVLLAGDGEVVRGSARTIAGVSIFEALGQCRDLLIGFGGHAAAAGLSLPKEHLDAFRAALHDAVGARVEPEQLEPELALDAPLDLGAVDGRFWKVLEQFGPFGPENDKPLFWGRDLRLVGPPRTVGHDRSHLKLRVTQRGGSGVYPVIGFGLGEKLPLVQEAARAGRPLELAFCLEENHWNGRTELQLQAKDVRPQETAAPAREC